MTLNVTIVVILCFFSPNSIALQADYVAVVEDRPIMSAKYRLPFFHFWRKLTHPAARSLCDSWGFCMRWYGMILRRELIRDVITIATWVVVRYVEWLFGDVLAVSSRAASGGPVPSMNSNACGALNSTTRVTPTVVATKITSRILSTTVATSCHSARTLVCLSLSAARASFDLIILSTRSRVRWNCCSSCSFPPRRTSSIDVSMSRGRDARAGWPPTLPPTPAAESTTNGWDWRTKYEEDSDPFWRRDESSMSWCCCCCCCELGDSTSSLNPMFYGRQSSR